MRNVMVQLYSYTVSEDSLQKCFQRWKNCTQSQGEHNSPATPVGPGLICSTNEWLFSVNCRTCTLSSCLCLCKSPTADWTRRSSASKEAVAPLGDAGLVLAEPGDCVVEWLSMTCALRSAWQRSMALDTAALCLLSWMRRRTSSSWVRPRRSPAETDTSPLPPSTLFLSPALSASPDSLPFLTLLPPPLGTSCFWDVIFC
ncbi:hypothetical protein J437_LFUL005539 [Ladona fulva]|uniref:Uncharacterized protein n=1 Tax=Ladona fulva TaxID=123851 RepID=A0A8K0JWU7_LADFU|nr:hypothetical protein J437_LFUL005539 [Ladona fulva]